MDIKMRHYTLTLLSLVFLSSCGSHSGMDGSLAQSKILENQGDLSPTDVIIGYPEFIAVDIVNIIDDGTIQVSVTAIEFIDKYTLGEKKELIISSPSEIKVIDFLDLENEEWVLFYFGGKRYVTPKKL